MIGCWRVRNYIGPSVPRKSGWFQAERNTSYFHRVASVRARRNRIVCLKSVGGELVTGQDEIQHLVVSHFLELFQGSFCRNEGEGNLGLGLCNSTGLGSERAQLLSNLGVRLSDSQIRELELPFSEGEVRDAVFQMKGMKAPGPDGFVAGFYQKFWDWVGADVVQMVMAFLHSGVML